MSDSLTDIERRERLVFDEHDGRFCRQTKTPFLQFSRNDYLGLAQDPHLAETFAAHAQALGVGAGASHMVSGHHPYHCALEKRLAKFLQVPMTLLAANGFMANQAVLSCVLKRGKPVLLDRLVHASLIEGARLSRAKIRRFAHQDCAALETLLKQCPPETWIVVDGVYSMDGDVAPLPDFLAIAKRYQAQVLIDDAHGFGVLGEQGRGTLSHYGLPIESVDIQVGTLSKAAGTYGAFITGKPCYLDSIMQKARAYIYTTAIPPAIAAVTCTAIDMLAEQSWRRTRLAEHIAYFQQHCPTQWNPLKSQTPIQPLVLGSTSKALTLHNHLKASGIWVPVIRQPTVPAGSERLRISLSAVHTSCDLIALLQALDACVTGA